MKKGKRRNSGNVRALRSPDELSSRKTVRAAENTGTRNAPANGEPARQSAPRTAAGEQMRIRENGNAESGYRFDQDGSVRLSSDRRAAPVREVTAATTREDKKIVRKIEKEQKDIVKEQAWQENIVRVKGSMDVFLIVIILLLTALGCVAIFSASYPRAVAEGQAGSFYLVKHLKNLLAAVVLGSICWLIPPRIYKKWLPVLIYVATVGLLIATRLFGNSEGEAKRWISIAGFNIQASEIMKLALPMLLAWYYDLFGGKVTEFSSRREKFIWHALFPLGIVGLSCVLILVGGHLSGAIVVGIIGVVTIIVAGYMNKYFVLTALPAAVAAVVAYLIIEPYALNRLASFFNPNADVQNEAYQTTQSIYAIGSGGLFGRQIGQSIQKYSALPYPHTDFIFAIWCEETGFIGAAAVIALFLLFMWRGYLVSLRAPDKFSSVVAFAITTHIGLQALLNIFVVTGMMVNTGIPLPFISYGGSSIVVTMCEMGFLLRISMQSYRKQADIERDEAMKQAGLT